MALSDIDGTVTDRYAYDSFGELTLQQGDTVNPFLFDGRDGIMTDGNGLLYMRARYYNPEIKRFMNEDTYEGQIGNPLTLNLYAYVGNNPLIRIDPTGHCWICDEDTLKKIDEKVKSFCNWLGCKEFGQAIIDTYPIEQSVEVPIMAAPKVIEEAPAAWAKTKQVSGQAWSKVKGWFSKDAGNTATKTVDDILDGASPGRATKGKTTQYVKSGGYDQAATEFDSLNPSNVKEINTKYGSGKTGTLPDGRTITARPGSSDGRPTLEIRDSNGRGVEIRYGE